MSRSVNAIMLFRLGSHENGRNMVSNIFLYKKYLQEDIMIFAS